MNAFTYEPTLQLGGDETAYRKLSGDFVSMIDVDGHKLLRVAPEGLKLLAKQAFIDISFYLRPGHLKQLAEELKEIDRVLADAEYVLSDSRLRDAYVHHMQRRPT